jgi:hypothetical protein
MSRPRRDLGPWSRRVSFSTAIALALGMVLARADIASPGTDVEILGGGMFFAPRLDESYDLSYTPSRVLGITQLFDEPDPRSRATQSLTLKASTGTGLGLGVSVFPHPVLGFQVLLDRAHADLSGTSPPHVVDLVWDSIAFPSSEHVERSSEFSFDAPATAGRVEEQTLSFNAVARLGRGSAVSGNVSFGLSYFRLRAEELEVGALAGWLGGHAVLFTELYQMSLATETASTFGLDVGADVSVALAPKVAVFADGRFFYGPTAKAPVHLDSFVSDNVVTVPIEKVESLLALPPLELDPRYFRLLIGVKLRL